MGQKNSLFLMLESYQAITGQEGRHIDELRMLIKCTLVKSKSLDKLDKQIMESMILERLEREREFCVLTEKYDALEIVSSLHQVIKN
ncbi:hypothetical protein [Vibrio diabolicus]|uniref:hypothetical protein n=1 Tax=Vibrio diabolicus TaxID=50719 RepID=UPI002494BFFD|nr:hypothetical protein [Vibrio diabolicus]